MTNSSVPRKQQPNKKMTEIKIEKLTNRLYRLIDASYTAMYLAVGDTKAALLDTGTGVGNLKEAVQSITDKPLIIILTHGHIDHMGGLSQFPDTEIYLNPKDNGVFLEHNDLLKRYEYTARFSPDVQIGEMSPVFTGELKEHHDKDVFDLGNLHIEMIEVPGHTQGMTCPLICEERTIIFGDACGMNVMLFDKHASCISAYKKSLLHLKQYESQYDTVYRNHGTYTNSKLLLDNVIQRCDDILNHKDDHAHKELMGHNGYFAKKVSELTNLPVDGKEGNIFYTDEKAK